MLALDIADDVHHFGDIHFRAALIDNRERSSEALGKRACALHAAGIRGNHRDIPAPGKAIEVVDHHGQRKQMVDRNFEEALNLSGVQVESKDTIRTGRFQQSATSLAEIGIRGLVLSVLPRVAIIGSTAVMRSAEARFSASIISSTSIRWRSTGVQVGWTTKTSAPRTFSRICRRISPSEKRLHRIRQPEFPIRTQWLAPRPGWRCP